MAAHSSPTRPPAARRPQAPSAALPREIEWQLSAPDIGAVRRWLTQHKQLDGLLIEPRPTQQLHDTYLDTDDWRLFRAGYALRMRNGSGKAEATLKSFKSARGDMADRVELNEHLGSQTRTALMRLRGPVGTRVQAVAGRQPLQALFEVRSRRQRFAVRGREGPDLGEIALDETVISPPDGVARARVQRVEVEALTDDPLTLAKLVESLRTECALQRATHSKYELALRSLGLTPPAPEHVAPAALEASMPAAEAARAALRRQLTAWSTYEPAARLGDDPEAVHALRVSARRIEAILGLFAPYLPRSLGRARARLKEVLHSLGEVRDLDLQLAKVSEFRQELSPAQVEELSPLVRHLESERARARAAMLRALDAQATVDGLARLHKTLVQPAARARGAAAALVDVAPGLIRDHFRKLRKAFKPLDEDAPMEAYHRARRRAKQLRYALEPVAALYGPPAEDLLGTLRRLQERLGAQQDAHVAMTRLTELAARPPQGLPSITVFLMGRLAERQARAPAGVRKRIHKTWRKLLKTRWKALEKAMDEPPAQIPAEVDA